MTLGTCLDPRALASVVVLSLGILGGSAAMADEAHRVRGQVVSLDGNALVVATREGPEARIALSDGWKVTGVARAAMSDIDAGDYVGIASMPMADGTAGALEVLIFPQAMAGAGEGSYPWDLQPGSTMTNATVAEKVETVNGHKVSLAYGGGKTKEIVIPDDAAMVTFAPATPADLVAGATVFVPGHADASGAISTGMVVVGLNGVLPPM